VGSTVRLTPQPDQQSYFAHWDGACSTLQAECDFVVTRSSTLTAHFAAKASARYAIVDIGTLGGRESEARGISPSSGKIVGESQNAAGEVRAFYWDGEVLTDVGAAAPASAFAVNDGGAVVGQFTLQSGGSFFEHAFILDRNGLRDLGVLPGGHGSHAFAVASNGSIVGGGDDGAAPRALVWSAGATRPTALPVPNQSVAMGLNDAGAFIGSAPMIVASVPPASAFSYDTSIHAIVGASVRSGAMGINIQGQIVGWMEDAQGTVRHGFWYDPVTGVRTVVSPVSRLPDTFLLAINGAGQAVGYASSDLAGPPEAGIVYLDGNVRALSDLVDGQPQILSASGIDSRGRISATAFLSGARRAVLLEPQ
jgi:probable HAF family extracellular repeat protein